MQLFSASFVLSGIFNGRMQSVMCIIRPVAHGGATAEPQPFTSLAAASPCQGEGPLHRAPAARLRSQGCNAGSAAPSSSLNQTLQRQKQTALLCETPVPGSTLPGDGRRERGPSAGTSCPCPSRGSDARALPSPPHPCQPPHLPRKGWASSISDKALGSGRLPETTLQTLSLCPSSCPGFLSPPLIAPLAKGKPFHGKGCSTVRRTFRARRPSNSTGHCKVLGDKQKEHTEQ